LFIRARFNRRGIPIRAGVDNRRRRCRLGEYIAFTLYIGFILEK
jgi:hypothetical protein